MSRRASCCLVVILLIAGLAAACEPAPEEPEDLIAMGEPIYGQQCEGCHGPDGMGLDGAYPALADNQFVLGEPEPVIDVVLRGRGGMPPFGGQLDDQQIAAVLSYIRNTWGNDAPVVRPEDVAAER